MHREDFPMFKEDIIYLDNGATTFKPKSVLNKMNEYYETYSANAHRGDYSISYKVDVEFEDGFVDRVEECCSACHEPNGRRCTYFCPNCGAKMDG